MFSQLFKLLQKVYVDANFYSLRIANSNFLIDYKKINEGFFIYAILQETIVSFYVSF